MCGRCTARCASSYRGLSLRHPPLHSVVSPRLVPGLARTVRPSPPCQLSCSAGTAAAVGILQHQRRLRHGPRPRAISLGTESLASRYRDSEEGDREGWVIERAGTICELSPMKGQALPQDALDPSRWAIWTGPDSQPPAFFSPAPARACSSWRMPWLVLVGPWRTRVFALLLISKL